jgi:hypothetical protein
MLECKIEDILFYFGSAMRKNNFMYDITFYYPAKIDILSKIINGSSFNLYIEGKIFLF